MLVNKKKKQIRNEKNKTVQQRQASNHETF